VHVANHGTSLQNIAIQFVSADVSAGSAHPRLTRLAIGGRFGNLRKVLPPAAQVRRHFAEIDVDELINFAAWFRHS
jgi:hypothetical protein